MGVRSDVGLALTEKAVQILKKDHADVWAWLNIECTDHQAREDAQLFIFECVKWYNPEVEGIKNLYDALEGLSQEYKLVDVCGEYPLSDENDSGSWDDNPWGLCRNVTAELYIR